MLFVLFMGKLNDWHACFSLSFSHLRLSLSFGRCVRAVCVSVAVSRPHHFSPSETNREILWNARTNVRLRFFFILLSSISHHWIPLTIRAFVRHFIRNYNSPVKMSIIQIHFLHIFIIYFFSHFYNLWHSRNSHQIWICWHIKWVPFCERFGRALGINASSHFFVPNLAVDRVHPWEKYTHTQQEWKENRSRTEPTDRSYMFG